MYAGKLPLKFAHNVSMRARAGFAISARANMSAVKRCSCRWSIPPRLECVDMEDSLDVHKDVFLGAINKKVLPIYSTRPKLFPGAESSWHLSTWTNEVEE